jgi:ZIP family zinc transporter
MPLSLQAGLWGLLAGSALLIGAAIGYMIRLPQRLIATIMAFGAGTLISAMSFELMDEAYKHGGFWPTAIGFIVGAAIYTIANWIVSHHGARHRKRSDGKQPSEAQHAGSGMALAIGALLDGIPESVVIGTSMLAGGAVSWVAVVAIFISNIPEGLSSSAGMRKAHRSALYVFGLWTGIAVISGIAAWAGCAIFGHFSPNVVAATTALAAGAILSMLADTMMPEAYEYAHDFAGLVTVVGFLVAFVLSKLGG